MCEVKEELNLSLSNAARFGDISNINACLRAGADVNAADKHNRPAIWLAAKGGHVNVVNALLEAQADPNAADQAGNTPLMEGCIYGHTAVVYALIQAGANLALENQPGFRAQTLAVKRGNNTIADALETAGAWNDLEEGFDPAVQLAFQKAWQAPKETEAETAAGEKKTPLIPQKKHEPVKVPEQGTQTKLKKRHLLSGMKHLVEEVLVEVGPRNEVCLEGCVGIHFRIVPTQGETKFKALTVTGCSDCTVVFPTMVGNLEVINSNRVLVRPTGHVAIIQIDGSDRITVELSTESQDTSMYTAKSSCINMRRPEEGKEGSLVEFMLPEQVKHTFDSSWKVSSVPVSIE